VPDSFNSSASFFERQALPTANLILVRIFSLEPDFSERYNDGPQSADSMSDGFVRQYPFLPLMLAAGQPVLQSQSLSFDTL
jgi:hypothetical protein